MQTYKKGLVWLRRDFRLKDNSALKYAIKQCEKIIICFIFDKNILDKLEENDKRIPFIMDSIREIDKELTFHQTSLLVHYGFPTIEIPKIIKNYHINALFYNRDYEPYAISRDSKIEEICNIPIHNFKDSVIHEKNEIKTKNDGFYTVFTPYKNNWLTHEKPLKNNMNLHKDMFLKPKEASTIQDDNWYSVIGFSNKHSLIKGGRQAGLNKLSEFKQDIHNYDQNRDYPSLNKTSRLSVYLRFGCISIRECVEFALKHSSVGAQIWLSELIWRDFYQMVCATHPNCDKQAIKPIYDTIQWQGKEEWFTAWCNGQTGFPIVDAAMRQLNQTGFMHNRCRMITASFLCKTLLVDWREGEAYFAKQLLDFDFASNNGGWQWSSSSGCDAQPYFRIFNPYSQSEKFDASGDYIRTYCPELNDCTNKDIHKPEQVNGYPNPIVDYKTMREKALEMYSVVKK